MSERCCRYLSEREGIDAICSDRPLEAIAQLPAARVVALWHVLEHLPNPAEVLARVAEKVEPGGLLAIAVPNPRSLAVSRAESPLGASRRSSAPVPDAAGGPDRPQAGSSA